MDKKSYSKNYKATKLVVAFCSACFFSLLFLFCEVQTSNVPLSNTVDSKLVESNFVYRFQGADGLYYQFHFLANAVKLTTETNETFTLKKIKATEHETEYASNGFRFLLKEKQDPSVLYKNQEEIPLVLLSPLYRSYASKDRQIQVVYFEKDNDRLVQIQNQNGKSFDLEQKEVWAKGAEYSDGVHSWRIEKDTAIFRTGQTKEYFKEQF